MKLPAIHPRARRQLVALSPSSTKMNLRAWTSGVTEHCCWINTRDDALGGGLNGFEGSILQPVCFLRAMAKVKPILAAYGSRQYWLATWWLLAQTDPEILSIVSSECHNELEAGGRDVTS
jgi:hypothetical protein